MSTLSPRSTPARGFGVGAFVVRAVSVWGLLFLLLALIVTFSLLLPQTFPTAFTFTSLANSRSIYALAALAVMIPLAANQFDLSVAGTIGLSQILAIGLQTEQGLPWGLACLAVVAIGVLVGAINAFLVAYVRIHAFIATLGTGSVLIGVLQWYTQGRQVLGTLPDGFIAIAARVPGTPVPMALVYVIVIAFVLWLVFEYTPDGRYIYVIGDNPRAAESERDPRSRVRLGVLRRLRRPGGDHGDHPAGAASGRAEHGRAGVPSPRIRRGAPWRNDGQARPGQRAGAR